ncbi:hypothetical protein DL770_000347 [Monosporascus sp. CRB-9-2]|nr:hypothetical protein DL770_000347 [Monosporascus sp. CRB-9-2]
MVSGKATASTKDAEGQPETVDLEQLMKVVAKLSDENVEKKDTYLDWKYFDFKLGEENRLRGSDNWEMWKTAFWVALMAIGYSDGNSAKLTPIDEAKLAAAVVANVKEGIDQKMDLRTQLQFVKWNSKQSALDHVADFKNLVRQCNEVDMPVNAGQQVTMFINSIRDDGAAWKSRIRGALRQHPTMTDGQPLCFKCGEYGHMAKDRPQKRKRTTECEASFIPRGLEDLYRSSRAEL